ncbi:hypothetical protein V1523DRAFT_396941 [Lipomyces doorenjongii]
MTYAWSSSSTELPMILFHEAVEVRNIVEIFYLRQFLSIFCSMCHRQSWFTAVGNTTDKAFFRALSESVRIALGASSGNRITSVIKVRIVRTCLLAGDKSIKRAQVIVNRYNLIISCRVPGALLKASGAMKLDSLGTRIAFVDGPG